MNRATQQGLATISLATGNRFGFSPNGISAGLVAAFFVAALGAEWLTDPWPKRACVVLCCAIAILGIWWLRRTPSPESERRESSRSAWQFAGVATLLGLVIVAVLAACLGTWSDGLRLDALDRSAAWFLLIKLPTVAIQQVALHRFVVPGLRASFGKSILAVLLGTSLFAALHLPNPLLVGLTWIAGWFWIAMYWHFGKLAPLIASHFILAVALASFGGEFVLNMRVGASCLPLLPRHVITADGPLEAMANAASGRILRVTQKGDSVIVQGLANDVFKNVPAQSFFVVNRARTRAIPANVEVALEQVHPGEFRLRIPLRTLLESSNWELFARSVRGWSSSIGPLPSPLDIRMQGEAPLIQLFPVVLDGRCETLAESQNACRVSGWAIDVHRRVAPSTVAVCSDGRSWIGSLNAKIPREDLRTAWCLESPPQCGFELVIPGVALRRTRNFYLFAVDENEVWHPLRMTPKMCERIAESWPRIQLPRCY